MSGVPLLIACILFSACASFFLKLGALSLKEPQSFLTLITNPMLWVGGFFYAAAFLGYIYLLRLLPLSLAQPAITVGVSALSALAAALFLREQMSLINWAGLSIVCVGVFFLFFGRT